MKRFLMGGAFALAAMSSATAGPVADFETQYRQMYGIYRIALFKTNAGDAEASTGSMGKFAGALGKLVETWGAAPPPQYADDPEWSATIETVQGLAAKAEGEIAAGNLPEAHETLEGVRDVFGALHIRNGVETFSDRMNAYHAEMEHLLGMDMAALDEGSVGEVRERAAVLSYLAADVLGAPPVEAEGNEEYAKLAAGFEASVKALVEAARTGDLAAVKAAVAGVKKPYAMFFVKFG